MYYFTYNEYSQTYNQVLVFITLVEEHLIFHNMKAMVYGMVAVSN